MTLSTYFRAAVVIAIACSCGMARILAAPASAESAASVIPVDAEQVRELVARLDQRMFAAYNAHDVDGLMAWFADDLEFFHDTGGLLGFEQVKSGFTNVFTGNPDIHRELVPGSLEANPIPGYGAMEIGTHRFCHAEAGSEVCGTFKFVQIWRLADGTWKVAREVSYGH